MCDFNLSRVMEESAILSSMAASNPRWLAPEILSGRGYTFSSDVYSFGVIMWEFLTWQIPWHECGPWQVIHCSRHETTCNMFSMRLADSACSCTARNSAVSLFIWPSSPSAHACVLALIVLATSRGCTGKIIVWNALRLPSQGLLFLRHVSWCVLQVST